MWGCVGCVMDVKGVQLSGCLAGVDHMFVTERPGLPHRALTHARLNGLGCVVAEERIQE